MSNNEDYNIQIANKAANQIISLLVELFNINAELVMMQNVSKLKDEEWVYFWGEHRKPENINITDTSYICNIALEIDNMDNILDKKGANLELGNLIGKDTNIDKYFNADEFDFSEIVDESLFASALWELLQAKVVTNGRLKKDGKVFMIYQLIIDIAK